MSSLRAMSAGKRTLRPAKGRVKRFLFPEGLDSVPPAGAYFRYTDGH